MEVGFELFLLVLQLVHHELMPGVSVEFRRPRGVKFPHWIHATRRRSLASENSPRTGAGGERWMAVASVPGKRSARLRASAVSQ